MPFARYEHVDTQAGVRENFSRADEGRRDILVVGVSHFLHPMVVLKVDVEHWRDGTGDKVTRTNVGLGFQY